MWEITSTQHHDIQPPTPSTAINYNREIREAGRSGRLRTRMPRKDGAERPGRSGKDGAERPGEVAG